MGAIKDILEMIGPHKHVWRIRRIITRGLVEELCVCGSTRYLKDRFHYLNGSLVEGYSLKEIEKYDTKFKR